MHPKDLRPMHAHKTSNFTNALSPKHPTNHLASKLVQAKTFLDPSKQSVLVLESSKNPKFPPSSNSPRPLKNEPPDPGDNVYMVQELNEGNNNNEDKVMSDEESGDSKDDEGSNFSDDDEDVVKEPLMDSMDC